MSEWYRFEPQDTLFFRGAEPAVMGESHSASFNFPPPPQTMAGALRTAVLVQNDIGFRDYKNGTCRAEILAAIGKAGEESPFGILGPFFQTGDDIWLPCPYTWFAEKEKIKGLSDGEVRIPIIQSKPVQTGGVKLKTSSGGKLLWVRENNLESLGGYWVVLKNFNDKHIEKRICGENAFFVREPHTGLAMDYGAQRRTARKHHLYSFVHARLREDVKLVFGVSSALPLQKTGVLKLGAEQRFGKYEKMQAFELPKGSSELFMALSLVEGNDDANKACVATGKIRYLGGWDMNRAFHKEMKGFFPAGTVFNQEIKEQSIQL
ncbi:MAG TPA: type III-B CRISPR module-associated Cmr3 family protein [Smithellaceae bacterium]|nr:type III-B CRISPR module-associated Cmr3 family protein [Smithellaceae bacterium]HRS90267.1 type III-B CRISPR module-associated Cmr3 family protein [Smithellaceae bacterium]